MQEDTLAGASAVVDSVTDEHDDGGVVETVNSGSS